MPQMPHVEDNIFRFVYKNLTHIDTVLKVILTGVGTAKCSRVEVVNQ